MPRPVVGWALAGLAGWALGLGPVSTGTGSGAFAGPAPASVSVSHPVSAVPPASAPTLPPASVPPSGATRSLVSASAAAPAPASGPVGRTGPRPSWTGLVKGLLQPPAARQAFRQLQEMGGKAVPAVRSMLGARNLRLVRAALDLCEDLEQTRAVARDLVRILGNTRLGGLRGRAARLLGRLDAPFEKHLPTVLKALRDPSLQVRLAVAESLLDWWSRRPSLVPELRRALADPRHPWRGVVADLLAQVGPLTHPLLPLAIAYVRTGRIEPPAVVAAILPRVLPGAGRLAQVVLETWAGPGAGSGPDPDAPAVDLPDAEAEAEGPPGASSEALAAAAQADQATSFEDIPAVDDLPPLEDTPASENPPVTGTLAFPDGGDPPGDRASPPPASPTAPSATP